MAERELPREYNFNGRTWKPHPAADCFPLMVGAVFKDLVEDIRANGMSQPVRVLGEYLLDGRNRVLAAIEAGLSTIPVIELPRETDAIALVASLNIHRRHLTNTQRSYAAANLLALSRAAYLDNNPGAVDPDTYPEDDDFGYGADGGAEGDGGPGQTDPQAGAAPGDAEPPGQLPDGRDAADLLLTNGGGPLTEREVADAYGVSRGSVNRADHVREQAPDLGPPMRDGVINLTDAVRIQHEPEEVRRQAVQDVRDGVASSATRAIRERYHREPVAAPKGAPPPEVASPEAPAEPPPGELTVSPAVLGYVRTLLGEIAFDPCSAEWCARRVRAAAWCGADQDGLLAEWRGAAWVFPPPDRAEPFLVKTLLELEAGRVSAAVALVPMAPWSDATQRAFGAPSFTGVVVPASPIGCKRPDGSAVRPPEPLWLLLFGEMRALPADVFGTFASTVLVPELTRAKGADAHSGPEGA